MTATLLKKHTNYVTDAAGQKVAVLFDLKNKQMQDFFEDLVDTLSVIERQNETPRAFGDFVKEYQSKQTK